MSTFFRIASLSARSLGSFERALTMSAGLLREATHGVLAAALHPDERSALGVALYESRLGTTREKLAPWEEAWFEADLPAPPGRILVGGAGDGREASWLAARGHHVAAFDPGTQATSRSQRALAASGGVAVRATYEEWAAVVLDHRGIRDANPALSARYDGVLLGWTSVMHVTDDHERSRLIETCDRICPDGPILLTFYPADRARPRGRAHRMGLRLGRRIARLRGGVELPADRESFGFACGFLRGWTVDEIESLAARFGRCAEWRGDDEGCLRVTLTPDSTAR